MGRIAAAVTTWFVAIAVALAVPVSQLRTVTVIETCCCPDPAHCNCPDREPEAEGQPTVKACHQERHVVAAGAAVSFTLPPLGLDAPSRARIMLAPRALAEPHAEPPPERPAAPS